MNDVDRVTDVPLSFAESIAAELDGARALLALRTADLVTVLGMADGTPWAKALGYAGATAHAYTKMYGKLTEPAEDGGTTHERTRESQSAE